MDVLPARSPEKLAEAKKKGGCKNLREEVMNWPTVQARDWKATAGTSMKRLNVAGKHRGTNGELPLAVYQEHLTQQDQANPSATGKSRGSLNPNWVEQLMGIPVGWTDLGYWGTELFQQQPPKHS
jgi:hypothetical protein